MITTPLIENSMNLIIPSSGVANSPVNASQVQTISIDRNEALKLNNQAIDTETLAARLLQLKARNADVAVVIRPDRELPVQKLIALMDALQRAQITKVGIATRSETK
jgi:biopolymer transport protein ExbD